MRERSVGLGVMGFHSFLQARGIAFEGAMAKSWNLKIFKHIRAQGVRSLRCCSRGARPCPDAADMGVMERFSCKMAIAPTASISIICGGTSACIEPIPANIYTHKTLSGSFTVRNPYLEKLLRGEGEEFDQGVEHDPERGGSVQHLDFLSAEEKATFKHQLRDRSALAARTRRRPHALHRSGAVTEPVHPGRCRQVGPSDAALPGVGAGHQVALLPAARSPSSAQASPAASRRTTPSRSQDRSDRGETTDYDECLACQ
jgi:ribonucleoside-diphosphate reductase alpha chain